MRGHRYQSVWLTVGVLAFTACDKDTPTQPSGALNPTPGGPALATTLNSWRPVAPLPGSFGSGPTLGAITRSDGVSRAYVFGGTNDVGGSAPSTRVYEVATNTWRATKGSSRVAAFHLNGVGKIGNKLYFSGGYDYGTGDRIITNAVWSFDPVTETVGREADMPLRTAEGVTGVIGERLYVLPGTCWTFLWPDRPEYCEHEPIRKLFRYNPATKVWATMRSAPHYHRGGVGGVINNKFYVAGGRDDRSLPTSKLDVYDAATNTWKTLAPLPAGFIASTGAVLRGQLFVVGATNGVIKHYAYNPTTNRWVAKAAPPYSGNPAGTVFLDGNSRLLVLSGGSVDYDAKASQLYTP